MEVSLIEKKDGSWDEFLVSNSGSFLQSFDWGEFQEKNLKKVFRFKVADKERVLLEAQIIEEKAILKPYFYIPYGPVFNVSNTPEENSKALLLLLSKIRNLSEKEGAIFLRMEPCVPLPELPGFKEPVKRVQPQKTLVLDIAKEEEKLLKDFKKRTRYNIKLAEKKGVKVRILDGYSKEFYKLLGKTKERQEFSSYPEDYYRELLKIKGNFLKSELLAAEYKGKIVVATIILIFGKTITSLHTGFDYNYRDLKAPYLLRWEIIKEGKRSGCLEFDMWGIDEKKWPGVTYLKKSFMGKEKDYGRGVEVALNNKWYGIYKFLRKIAR